MQITETIKHVKNIKGDTATMLLYKPIGRFINDDGTDGGIDGAEFANSIYLLKDYGINKINVRINSPGGSVLDGFSIYSAITNSGLSCDTYIDGIAASIAGIIAMGGEKVYMADCGLLMMHDPSMDNDDEQTAKDREALNLIKDSLITILLNKSGFDPEILGEMMSSETWLNADDACQYGLVDEVFSTNKKVMIDPEVMNNVSKLYSIYNNALINQNSTMTKVTTLLKLNNDASEDSIASEIEKLQTEIKHKEAKVAELQAKLDEANKAIADQAASDAAKNDAAAADEVENAIKANKIKAEEKEAWLKLAKVDLAAVKNAFAAMGKSTKAVKITDELKKKTLSHNGEDRSGWTIRDWEKKDAKGLKEIRDNAPELYQDMYEAYYKRIS